MTGYLSYYASIETLFRFIGSRPINQGGLQKSDNRTLLSPETWLGGAMAQSDRAFHGPANFFRFHDRMVPKAVYLLGRKTFSECLHELGRSLDPYPSGNQGPGQPDLLCQELDPGPTIRSDVEVGSYP